MPKRTQKKVGQILLKQLPDGRWRASWFSKVERRYIRQILPYTKFDDAVNEAEKINVTVANNKGYAPRLRGAVGHSISDAVKEAVKHTDAGDRTRADYLSRYNAFSDYLAEYKPGVKSWSDLNENILADYVRHCREEEIAADTLRMRLYVLRLTSAYLTSTYPEKYQRDICAKLRIKRSAGPAAAPKSDDILSPEKFREPLFCLKKNDPMVYLWALLQGACGLRELEAVYLREQDFNLAQRTISIAESAAHRPKNSHSFRTIPIPQTVAAALGEWILS